MIAPIWAFWIATAALWSGDWINRRVVGWIPEDPPRPGRKQHARPMPLAGFLVVPAIAPWLVAAAQWPTLAAALLAATVGFVDDARKERGDGLSWRAKALGLCIAAGLVAGETAAPWQVPGTFAIAFVLVFVVTNAVNFLDNTDGVAASLAAVTLLALGLGSAEDPAFAAAGFAALAFLPWNWPRPRMFLGDGGAYALGITAAAAAVQGLPAAPQTLWAVAVPLVDFVQVVLARLWLAVPPWVGDRRHLTHIVQNLGLPRIATAPLFAAVATALALTLGRT